MISVYINGVLQCPGVDFTEGTDTISFAQPPGLCDLIVARISLPNGGAHMQKLQGDGYSFLFKIDPTFKQKLALQTLADDLVQYQHHPSVIDLLNQLQVVIELVKQDDRN